MTRRVLLDRLLEPGAISVVFQPIVQRRATAWHLHAFEALVRGPRATNMENPEVLFEYVRRKGAEVEMDRHCIGEVLKAASALGQPRLCVNVHAATIESDAAFPVFLERTLSTHEFDPARLTIEIVEHAPSRSTRRFTNALEVLRSMGSSIALDDLGLGHSNYRMILECRPDYFKIDRYLIAGSSKDFYRRALLRSIIDLAGSFGAYAVGEGVDNPADLKVLLEEGLTTILGYLMARPASASHLGTTDFVREAVRLLPDQPDEEPWRSQDNWLAIASKLLADASRGSRKRHVSPTPAEAEVA